MLYPKFRIIYFLMIYTIHVYIHTDVQTVIQEKTLYDELNFMKTFKLLN